MSAHDISETGACELHDDVAPVNILVVEDNPGDALILCGTLERDFPGQYVASVAGTLKDAKSLLYKRAYNAILLDLSLPDSQGLETIATVAAAAPNLPIVVISGVADSHIVPEAVRSGAQDYLMKGQTEGASIARAIRYAMDRKEIEKQLRRHEWELERKNKELQEAQKRLEAYRDRYINLYDAAPLGYVTLDQDGYIQEINLAGAQMLGADRDTITGYPFSTYVVEEDVAALSEHLRKCVSERAELTSELRLVREGGGIVAVQLRSIPVTGHAEEGTFCKTAITDITQRTEMEDTIRQSNAFLQAVIDGIPEPILVIARDYRVVLANRLARERSMEANMVARGLPCYHVSHRRNAPCNSESEPCPLHQIIKDKCPIVVTHTHYDAKGDGSFVEITAAPVFDAAGEVSHIIETCRDITPHLQMEKTLSEDLNLIRRVIDAIPDCVYVKDAEGHFLAANLAAAQLMGVAAPAELLGRSEAEFCSADEVAQHAADDERIMRSGEPLVNKEETRVGSDGKHRRLLTTKVPVTNSAGKIAGVVAISRDISDRS